MSLSLITDASSFNEIPVPLQYGLVSRRIHIKFAFESTLQSQHCLFYEIPVRTSRVAVNSASSCISLPSGGGREN